MGKMIYYFFFFLKKLGVMLKFCYIAVFWRYEGSTAAASEMSVIPAGSVQLISKVATGSTLLLHFVWVLHICECPWVPPWPGCICSVWIIPYLSDMPKRRRGFFACLPLPGDGAKSYQASGFPLPCSNAVVHRFSDLAKWTSDYGKPVILFPSSEAQHVFKSY